jgi:Squalene-hopene cyclase C-terminal domain/Prenyltransferase and squalene oxidase repeat
MGLTCLVAAIALVASPQQFLLAHQQPDRGFAEPGGTSSVALSAWALLGLRAARVPADDSYVRDREAEVSSANDLALAVLAEAHPSPTLVDRLERATTGGAINATAWKLIALAQARRPLPAADVRFLRAHQSRSGGWSWGIGVAADSNDTAAVIEALRAAGVTGRPIVRGLAFLRRLQNRDGGFELVMRRGSDAQSTAWAVQAFLAAHRRPGARAYRYLARLRRADGSYRYSTRYAATPVWVTAQVLPALVRRFFPLR